MSDYSSNGVDLDDLLEARAGRTPIATSTGYLNQGVDLNDRFLNVDDFDAIPGPSLGYEVIGVDIGSILGANPSLYVVVTSGPGTHTSLNTDSWTGTINSTIRASWPSQASRDSFFENGGSIFIDEISSGSSSGGSADPHQLNVLNNKGNYHFLNTHTRQFTSFGNTIISLGYEDLTGSPMTLSNPSGGGSGIDYEILYEVWIENSTSLLFRSTHTTNGNVTYDNQYKLSYRRRTTDDIPSFSLFDAF